MALGANWQKAQNIVSYSVIVSAVSCGVYALTTKGKLRWVFGLLPIGLVAARLIMAGIEGAAENDGS